MKFGVIIHKPTMNLGDDIQTYAAAKLVPQVDYLVDRECIEHFESENNEPVAVVMNAWWMWKKWNWPPADCIIPQLTSMHINNYGIKKKSSPIYEEWLGGCGGEYMKAYGPVGCRDMATYKFLKELGIDCYFSGCLTLTIPKQKVTEDAGKYVCLVDLNPTLEKKAREYLKDTGLEIRVISHNCDYRKSSDSFEERMERVEELLTQYQNAKFVITRRLHCTLPCIALGTPVLSIVDLKNVDGNISRWEAYKDVVRYMDNSDFLKGNFEFDFNNPPENKEAYKEIRENLMREVQEFVDEYKDCDKPLDEVRKTTYSYLEKLEWKTEMMEAVMEKWLKESRALLKQKESVTTKYNGVKKELKQYKQYVQALVDNQVISAEDVPNIESASKKQAISLLKKIRRKIFKK